MYELVSVKNLKLKRNSLWSLSEFVEIYQINFPLLPAVKFYILSFSSFSGHFYSHGRLCHSLSLNSTDQVCDYV